jgi:hypothetical protein
MARKDILAIGPWGGAGCNADLHVISNDASKVTGDTKGSTTVRVEIMCLPASGPGGYSPRNCD